MENKRRIRKERNIIPLENDAASYKPFKKIEEEEAKYFMRLFKKR